MKITRKESEFQPVVITLETQEDLDVFITAMNIGCGDYFIEGDSQFVAEERVKELYHKDIHLKMWKTLSSFFK